MSTFNSLEGTAEGTANAKNKIEILKNIYEKKPESSYTLQSIIDTEMANKTEYERDSGTQTIMWITTNLEFTKAVLDQFYDGKTNTRDIFQVPNIINP